MLPAAGTPQSANVPCSPVAARTAGCRRESRVPVRMNSTHSPVTTAPETGVPSRASRTTPMRSAPDAPDSAMPHMAPRSIDADGVARSMRTGRRATLRSTVGACTPSESSSGCKKPTRYRPAGTSSIAKRPRESVWAERLTVDPVSYGASWTNAPASGARASVSRTTPLTRTPAAARTESGRCARAAGAASARRSTGLSRSMARRGSVRVLGCEDTNGIYAATDDSGATMRGTFGRR